MPACRGSSTRPPLYRGLILAVPGGLVKTRSGVRHDRGCQRARGRLRLHQDEADDDGEGRLPLPVPEVQGQLRLPFRSGPRCPSRPPPRSATARCPGA